MLRQKHDDVHASPAGVSTVENSKKNVQTTKYRKNIDNVVGKAVVKADAVSDTIQNSFFLNTNIMVQNAVFEFGDICCNLTKRYRKG